jgi:hypothetical protein
MIALAKALIKKLEYANNSLYHDGEEDNLSSNDKSKLAAAKLNDLAINLKLSLYNDKNQYIGKLLPVSLKGIQLAHMICPTSIVCRTATCNARSLVQDA